MTTGYIDVPSSIAAFDSKFSWPSDSTLPELSSLFLSNPTARQTRTTWLPNPLPYVPPATAAQSPSQSHGCQTTFYTANAPSVAAMGQRGHTTTQTMSKSKQSRMQLPRSTSGETGRNHSTSVTLADACKSNHSRPI